MSTAAQLHRQRVIVGLLSAVIASTSLLADAARGAEPSAAPTEAPRGQPDPDWRADGARVVEREAVPIAIPNGGGSEAAPALDPSVGLRGRPTIEGLPADRRPAAATEVEAWRTERSRSILNPDGTITAEFSGGRLNYQDAAGTWQILDVSLLAQAAPGGYEVAVSASDRQVRFSTDDIEVALAELSGADVSLKLRALDFPGVLTPAGDGTPPSAEPSASPEPTASSVATPVPEVTPSATAPSPSADPEPSPEPQPPNPTQTPDSSLGPDESSSPSPASSPSPGPSGSAGPSAEPPVGGSPSPSPSQAPSPSPSTAPPGEVPAWVLESNELRFTTDPALGTLVTRPTDTGLEFSVVVDSPDQPGTYAFAVDVGDLSVSLDTDGRTVLFDQLVRGEGATDRVTVGQVSAPVLLTANAAVAPPEIVTVTLYRQGDDGPPPSGVSSAALASLGPTEVLVAYAIDRSWMAGPDVVFPLTLDPTICIQVGGSGCTSSTFHHYVGSGQAGTYPNSPSMLRAGWDSIGSPDAAWAHLRSLLYFGDVSLPDGAQVTAASLDLRQRENYAGTLLPKIQARLMTKAWGSTTSWNDVVSAWNPAYNSPTYSPCTANPTLDCTLTMDVEKIVRAWYTRRGQDWKPNIGFMLVHEPSTWGETDFYIETDGTPSNRPKLTISYSIPAIEIDFATALGANYAPSTMVAGVPTTLRLLVDNNSDYSWGLCTTLFTTDCSQIGYRWFNAKGTVEGPPGIPSTGGMITMGTDDQAVNLSVIPPTTPGSYTLRLDYVRLDSGWGGTPLWGSDWAQPSKYFSRNKKVLSSDNTRWTGNSVIERDEFQIAVVSGGGTSVGEPRTVELGDGGSLGINLYSRNLHYEGAGGIGFDDLIPLELSYGYDSANAAADCPTNPGGVLDACGWYTNWDERLTPIPTIAGVYTYQGPSGNRYQVDTDGNGQLISGAPLLLERVRYTGFDENRPANAVAGSTPGTAQPAFVSGASEGVSTVNGLYIAKAFSNNITGIDGLGYVDLNAYPRVKFGVRTTSAASSGVAVKIRNTTDPGTYPDKWFVYTMGTVWTPPHPYFRVGGMVIGQWNTFYSDNLYERIRALPAYGKPSDSFEVVQVAIQGNGGGGFTYLDAVRFLGNDKATMTEGGLPWTTGTTTNSTDAAVGTYSVKVNASTGALAPSCQAVCLATVDPLGDLYSMPFASWHWRKVGGNSVAVEFNLQNVRTNAVGQITYYAGPVPPAGAINPIQVSNTVPVNWTRVTRNVLEDGRQVLNYFNDSPTGTSAGAPPSQGPTPDAVKWIGVKPWAPDGSYALFDDLRYGSVPRRDDVDTVFADDYIATYADGSEHRFNRDGLLEEIRDRDANLVTLDWVQDPAIYGQNAFTLAAIHAPSDGGSYDRQIDVAHSGSDWTFEEKLGAGVTGRKTVFSLTASDVTQIKPARTAVCGSSPSGCATFTYAASKLTSVVDPRKDGAGASNHRYDVTWSTSANPAGEAATTFPIAVLDASRSSAPLLNVKKWNVGSATVAATRVLWQDATMASASTGTYTDLTSDGSILYDHVPLACGGAPCTSEPSTGSLATQRLVANEFDGLARTSTEYRYSSASSTPLVSRQGTNAAAKVDNYNDPLAAGEVGWTQSPDQYFASVSDSNNLDRDLYRTFTTQDGNGNNLKTTSLVYNGPSDFAATTKQLTPAATSLKGYWRLGEASGSLAADLAVPPHAGTYAGTPGYGATGGLINDPDKAVTFSGDDVVTVPTVGTINGAFSVSAWAKPATTTGTLHVLGTRTGADYGFDFKFMNGTQLHGAIGNGTAWLTTAADAPLAYVADRWYQIVYTVTTSGWTIYVDGQPVGTGQFSGTPLLTDATRTLHIGDPGFAVDRFKGQIDEVAIYSQALTAPQVRSLFLAGRKAVERVARTTYDTEGHPIQIDDQFLANPGFESGNNGWDLAGGATWTPNQSHPPLDPAYPASLLSLQVGPAGKAVQDVALVPGQTARFQLWQKRVGAGSARIQLLRWQPSSAAWVSLLDTTKDSATWASHAWDVTLPDVNPPSDTDGRVRIVLSQVGGSGGDTIYFDDVALLTSYARTSYLANGLTDNAYTFAAADGSGASAGEIALHPAYAATGVHPAIFPTTTIVNDVASPSGPDQDVTSTATYDAWGRTLTTTDPDGVDSEVHYVASGNGIQTDIDWTEDGLDNRTTSTYDLVGNQLTATSPTGRVASTTYDLGGHPIRTTAPDGIVGQNDYDNFGQLTATWANHVNGNPDGGAGLDDVKTAYGYDEFGRVTAATLNDGGGLAQARTTTAFDLLDRVTAATSYSTFDGTTFAGSRRTEGRPEVSTYGLTRPGLAGTRGPGDGAMAGSLVPSGAPAPTCPDGSGVRCNSVTGRDFNGLAISLTDAYGKVSRTFHDLSGRPVNVIANYVDGVYSSAAPDTDVASLTHYDVGGRAFRTSDVLDRTALQTFDALGRSIKTVSYDSVGVAMTKVESVYTPAGRVDRASRPAAAADAPSAMAWTKTVYDGAGRAVTTLDNYDLAGAGTVIDGFEAGIGAWSSAGDGWFLGSGAVLSEATTAPLTGHANLAVTTTSAYTGAGTTLPGTYLAGHTYRVTARVNIASGAGAQPVQALFGESVSGSANYAAATYPTIGVWQAVSVTWAPSANVVGARVAFRQEATSTTYSFSVDDVTVWDLASPARNIPTTTAYDADGRVIRSILPPGVIGEPGLTTSTGYDLAGRVTSVTVNKMTGAGTPVDANLTTSTTYDALGRAITSTDPTGTVSRFAYDRLGRLTTTWLNYVDGTPSSATGDDDLKSTYAFDASGALTAYCPARNVQSADACDPLNSTTSSNAYKSAWHYAYDEGGHLTKQVPPVKTAGALTQLDTKLWTYDPGLRLTKACDAPAGATSCSTADRNSVPTYDALGRPTRLDTYTGSGTTLALRTESTYRGDGSVEQTKYSEGTTPTVKDTLDYAYDTLGRLDQLKRSGTVLSDLAWNGDGTIASRADGDAGVIGTSTFTYDWADRLTTVDLPDATFSTAVPTFSWRLDGLIAGRSWGAGTAASFSYDPVKRPTGITKGSLTFGQAYDRDGNVTSESRSLAGVSGDPGTGSQAFAYDAIGRVTASSGLASGSRSYVYDLDGNRVQKVEGGVTSDTTFDRTDQQTSVTTNGGGSSTVYNYDPYGNLTSNAESVSSVTAMTYDLADRLTGIDAAGTANDATFTLDALGRSRTRVLGGGTSTDTYSYAGTSETVLRISNSLGPTVTDSLVSPSGDRLGIKQGSTVNWLLPDLHGNVGASLSADETTVVNATRYDAYGQTLSIGAAGGTAVGQANWKYQGRLDVSPAGLATPLYDMSARFYSPGLGAFTQFDSVMGSAQNPLSMNRFLYALANPATFIDPSGHCSLSEWWCGAISQAPGLGGLAQFIPDDAPQQVSHAVAPYNRTAAVGIGFADRAGELATETAGGVAELAIQATRYQVDTDYRHESDLDNAIAAKRFADDPGGALRGAASQAALSAASWIGNQRAAILSGDPYREGRAGADVLAVETVVLGGTSAIRIGARAGRFAMREISGATRSGMNVLKETRPRNFVRFGEQNVPGWKSPSGKTERRIGLSFGTSPRYKGPGVRLPFHGHIYRFNLFKPWTWLDRPPPKPPAGQGPRAS